MKWNVCIKVKLLCGFILIIAPYCLTAQGNIGIGTALPDPSAGLHINYPQKGLLIPRMTTTFRNDLPNPAKGLLVYDSSHNLFYYHDGSSWKYLPNGNFVHWFPNGSNIYTPAPKIGIGTSSPQFGLHVMNSNSADGGYVEGIMVENTVTPSIGEAAVSFRNKSFSEGKQWSIGLNQNPQLAFSFGELFTGANTRMAIDTLGRVGIGTIDMDPSAQVHMNSTNRGLIVPRMTSSQRNAIVAPALGLLVFDTDKHTLYMFDGTAWVAFAQQAPGFMPITLRTVDTIPQSFLDMGNDVAVDGELAVTRSTQYALNGLNNVGCVFVFKKNGGKWDYVQHIIPDIVKQNAFFGHSLALSGNILVVGSPNWDTNLSDKGKVWYYEWNGSAFQFLDSLVISPGSAGAYFGFSVALKGNTLVVGASEENTNGTDAGGIYVYTFNPDTKRFGSRVRLSAPNAKAGDKLGYNVAVDGAYIAAGAPFHPFGTGVNKGVVHVWTGSGSSWGYQDSCTYASASTNYERLGLRISLSGSNLVAGANYRLSDNYNPGSAIYFRRSGSQWSIIQEIRSDDSDNSFTVPDVVTVGNWLLVGNSAEDHLAPPRGNVWVYALESGQWVRKRRIYNYTTTDNSQRFPDALAFDGNTIMVGSYTYNSRQGAVYFTTVIE